VLTRVAAVLLALAAAAPTGPPQPDLPSVPPISVAMTTHNDGRTVSLLDRAHPAWAHLAPTGAVAKITATVELHGNAIHEWVAHLDTPDAFQGVTPPDCRGDEEAPPQEVSCDFAVQAASGVNRLQFHFSADEGRVEVDVQGQITGGAFDWDAGWEVLDATGQWSAIAGNQTITLPATLPSAVRYVVTNTGDIPFRVANGCDDRSVASGGRVVCVVRGVRPAQSLARSYDQQLLIVDATGATAEPELQARVRSVAAATPGLRAGDAEALLWPLLMIPLALLLGLLVLLLLRRRRRLSRAAATALTESREPPDPGSCQGASPATQEPAAVRRS
jgi:hypothetical protein